MHGLFIVGSLNKYMSIYIYLTTGDKYELDVYPMNLYWDDLPVTSSPVIAVIPLFLGNY